MISEEEKKQLLDKLAESKTKISSLRKELDKANNEKEALFSEKEVFSKQIVALIAEIKELRSDRDGLTSGVQVHKERRTELNKKINELISEIKLLQKQRSDSSSGSGFSKDPHRIKKEIEALEFKIETQPMKFDAEQKLMKQIKSLKKEIAGSASMTNLNSDIKTLSKEIDKLKKEADSIHKILQDNAVNSQEKHEKMIDLSKKVDELKKQEQEAYKAFFAKKEGFSKLNTTLKEYLKELAEFTKVLEEKGISVPKRRKVVRKSDNSKIIQEKQQSANEKIQKGKKLTTEDLLAFQKLDKKKR